MFSCSFERYQSFSSKQPFFFFTIVPLFCENFNWVLKRTYGSRWKLMKLELMNLPCCRCQWVSCTPRRCWSKGCCSTSHSRGSLLAEYTSPQTGTPCSSDNHSVLTLWVQQQLEYIQYIDICDECAHNGVFTLSSFFPQNVFASTFNFSSKHCTIKRYTKRPKHIFSGWFVNEN